MNTNFGYGTVTDTTRIHHRSSAYGRVTAQLAVSVVVFIGAIVFIGGLAAHSPLWLAAGAALIILPIVTYKLLRKAHHKLTGNPVRSWAS